MTNDYYEQSNLTMESFCVHVRYMMLGTLDECSCELCTVAKEL